MYFLEVKRDSSLPAKRVAQNDIDLKTIMIYTLTLNPAVDRELTVPSMEFDCVLRASEARIDFGGKGFNVSRLLKGMNEPSTAVGFVGGRSGELLQDGLRSLGIHT